MTQKTPLMTSSEPGKLASVEPVVGDSHKGRLRWFENIFVFWRCSSRNPNVLRQQMIPVSRSLDLEGAISSETEGQRRIIVKLVVARHGQKACDKSSHQGWRWWAIE